MARRPRDGADPSANFAAQVFRSHGLGYPGFWGTNGIPSDESRPDAVAEGLCKALAQLGGVYGIFARFLNWRADLLRASYIAHLRRIGLKVPVVSPRVVAARLRREFGTLGYEPVSALSATPLWSTPFRTAYLSRFRYQPIIVEVAREPIPEESFQEFEKGLRALGHPELASLVEAAVLREFREYVRGSESLVRERSFLDVLTRHRGETLAEYPRPIPELCSPNVLCWPASEGRPVAELIQHGDSNAPVLIASVILEQFFSLSMVEADLALDAMVIDQDNRLHFRRLASPVAVLPGAIDTGIKYVASVLARNGPRSAQTLIRLVNSQPPLDLEKQLMKEFSGVEPELKINMWFPASAAAFENNWRALAKLTPLRPLFLDCLHRNLLAAGYWNSDAVAAGGETRDAIFEGTWPAVRRVLRDRFDALLDREALREWAVGSGMLMVSTLYELNRQVEELRDNDLTVGVERIDWHRAARTENHGPSLAVLGILLLLFLLTLQWGSTVPQPWSLLVKILAGGTLAAMFWAISKIR
jgi:hypothetical protein